MPFILVLSGLRSTVLIHAVYISVGLNSGLSNKSEAILYLFRGCPGVNLPSDSLIP